STVGRVLVNSAGWPSRYADQKQSRAALFQGPSCDVATSTPHEGSTARSATTAGGGRSASRSRRKATTRNAAAMAPRTTHRRRPGGRAARARSGSPGSAAAPIVTSAGGGRDLAGPARGRSVGPQIDVGRLDAHARQPGADLAAVVRAVVQDLGDADPQGGHEVPAVAVLGDVGVRIERP